MRYNYTEDDIVRIYDEVDRRVEIDESDGCFRTIIERVDYRNAILQGVYSVLMVSSTNWSWVCGLCRDEEQNRYDSEFIAAERLRESNSKKW